MNEGSTDGRQASNAACGIPPDLTIRAGRHGDLPSLLALETAAFSGDRLRRRSLARLLTAPTATLLVALMEGELVGYALVLFRRGSDVARLYSLARNPARGPRGTGAALLEAAEAAAADRKCREIRLEVRGDNRRGLQLYRQHGYRVFARRPDYYEDGAEALRMRKRMEWQAG
jgi:[ribosomal protein S18]-alanine N-acetyltransferase